MFQRLLKIITEEEFVKIKEAQILLVGLGGVGGFTLEALVRCGFSNITIIDGDNIDITNLNRQIITNKENIGNSKVLEAKKRALNINKDLNIKEINTFLTKDNITEYLNNKYDYIIDACDDKDIKVELIRYAQNNNIKIITCLGTARKIDPTKLEITTLNKTYNDPLAKRLREILRKENISLNTKVVWSKEETLKTEGLGSAIFVPGVAGLLLVNYVFRDIIGR